MDVNTMALDIFSGVREYASYDFSLDCDTLGVFKEFVGTGVFVGTNIPGVSSNPRFCIYLHLFINAMLFDPCSWFTYF